jgi:hypothetical protein
MSASINQFEHAATGKTDTASTPSALQVLLFVFLLPAAVSASNQLMLGWAANTSELRVYVYPSMAASTAVLSWCVGRYLQPTWLTWLIFGWCLSLLGFLTIAACLGGPVRSQFGYILVSAQVSLLVLWAILGPGTWQWRLPIVAAAAPLVLMFSGSFVSSDYTARLWNIMMLLTALVAAVLCTGLRYFGFSLQQHQPMASSPIEFGKRPTYQFGMKHILIWMTVSGPLLLFVRALDFDGKTVFPLALLSMSVATVNLIAIWAVLGGGFWFIRLAALFVIPYLIAWGLTSYSAYLSTAGAAARTQYRSISYAIVQMSGDWFLWICLNTTLLAALLLFLRARGYQLVRRRTRRREQSDRATVAQT